METIYSLSIDIDRQQYIDAFLLLPALGPKPRYAVLYVNARIAIDPVK